MDQNLNLEVVFNEVKLKLSIANIQSTIEDLKTMIVERLAEQGLYVDPHQCQCVDSDRFILNSTEMIQTLLKENETIHLIQKGPEKQQIQITNTPAEAIVVIYDVSGSMQCQFFGDKDLSRMGAVNALFSAFADKTLAFEYNHLVKLVCFSSTIEDKCDFMNDFNKFILLVDGADAGGSTRCYDAIDYAITQLQQIKLKYPDIVLRIIALTDGEDNSSQIQPNSLVQKIFDNKIIIDSFVVSNDCIGLKTLTHASNGRCYCPQDLAQGLQLFEIESILSTAQREKVDYQTTVADLNALKERPFDTDGMKVVTVEVSQKAVMRREEMMKKAQESINQQAQPTGKSNNQQRIYKELNSILTAGKQSKLKVFPTADNLNLWKVLIIGPKDTPFEKGIYQLCCNFPNEYPFRPPKINFNTKIYHPNVSRAGSICMDILTNQWSPALTLETAIQAILNMMVNPNADDALDSNIAAQYKHEKELYTKTAEAERIQFASPTIEELLMEILGNIGPDQQEYLDAKNDLTEWINYQ